VRARELLRRLDDVEVAGLTSVALAEAIAASVRDGRLPAGVELPSERDLAATLGRSRGTVGRAYARVRSEGLAHTRQGAATTVGCCAGPWASSRAAELEPILPVLATPTPTPSERVIDLRTVLWSAATPAALVEPEPAMVSDDPILALCRELADRLAGWGLPAEPDLLTVVDGGVRALEVVLATLVRPGDRVLVPALTDPRTLALLHVRGLHPVPLPVDRDGRADVPRWLTSLRSRAAAVAVAPATHAAPSGTVLRPHERRLLVEAAAAGDVTLVDDLSDAELWTETPPPAALSSIDGDERTVTIATTAASAPPGAAVGWIHTPSRVLAERLRAVATATDAAPAVPVAASALRATADRDGLLDQRRQHLIDHTALTIRLITPVTPLLSVAPGEGGPLRLLHLGALTGSAVADAARDRGVLVHPGGAATVGAGDPSSLVVSLTPPTSELVTGLRVLIEVVRELT
jgi:DNA-binding transcriptional MocR family regulator